MSGYDAGMKKILLAAALAFAAPAASAATWEYASYIDYRGNINSSAWSAPEGAVKGDSITDVLKGIKCEREGLIGLFNCLGAQGWELSTFTQEVIAGITIKNYIFKRVKAN